MAILRILSENWSDIQVDGLNHVSITISIEQVGFEPGYIVIFKGNFGDVIVTFLKENCTSIEVFPEEFGNVVLGTIDRQLSDIELLEVISTCSRVSARVLSEIMLESLINELNGRP